MSDRIDPTVLARLLQAVTEGAQMQWLVEPELDMAALFALVTPEEARPEPHVPDAGPPPIR